MNVPISFFNQNNRVTEISSNVYVATKTIAIEIPWHRATRTFSVFWKVDFSRAENVQFSGHGTSALDVSDKDLYMPLLQ